jgi:sugar phosphate isomerase/epimerase
MTISRRSFLKTTSVASAALLITPAMAAARKKTDIGVQLYTVRDAMGKDPRDTLAKVAAIGYTTVEGATYTGSQKFYGMDPKEFAGVLKSNGLWMPSAHYRLGEEKSNGEAPKGTMLNDWAKAVDDAAAVGIKYMVCAWLAPVERGNLDHYKALAGHLNTAGETCKKAGIQMCYHNHDFEFDKQGTEYPFDVVMANTDKDLVKFEMDLYWVSKAGQDPIALFDKYPKRFPLLHMKDMDNTDKHAFTEVGHGVIDFKKILAHSNTAGMKYFFVEQDICPGSPFDSIKFSYDYIKNNLV